MKKSRISVIGLSAVTLLLLAGCEAQTFTYNVTLNTQDADKRSELIKAVRRVVERRLQAIGEEPSIDVRNEQGQIIVDVDVEDPIVGETLTDQLQEPFTMRIMTQVADGKGDVTIEGQGSFKESGITEKHLLWVTAGPDTNPEKGRVLLEFSEDGRKLMGQMFRQNSGKYIGLFVRNRLVSKLLVESSEVKETILITDIPSPILAEIFADDLNVGLYVIFTPGT